MENHISARKSWSRKQLLVAFNLYCQMPFGKMHSRNPVIIEHAELIGRTPSALAMKLTNIASLDPAITVTGRKGLAGASAADKSMWNEMQSNWCSFSIDAQHAAASFGVIEELDADIDSMTLPDENIDYTGGDKTVQSTTRLGQAFFRRSVLSAYNYRCCITGLSIPRLLIASHIVPWRVDEKNRLNPRNGLCLSMLHDKAFDNGIITILDDMTIRVSQKYTTRTDPFFTATVCSFEGKQIALPDKFSPYSEFLSYHRQHIFKE
jgi:putative restriction endonuclease